MKQVLRNVWQKLKVAFGILPRDEYVSFDSRSIYTGHHKVTYKGIKTIKCPFDYVIFQMIIFEVRPDLIIVDYADLLKPPRYFKDKRLELGNIYEELRGMSGDFNIPIWTASQSNRSGAETDVIVGEQISEDYQKIMIGDFIMSVSRKEVDNESKTARIFIIKNRFGVDKIRFPAKFNVYNGSLSIFDQSSIQGKQLNEKMNGDAILKKALKERFNKKNI